MRPEVSKPLKNPGAWLGKVTMEGVAAGGSGEGFLGSSLIRIRLVPN